MSMEQRPSGRGGRTAAGVLVGAVAAGTFTLFLRLAAVVARAAFGTPDRTAPSRRSRPGEGADGEALPPAPHEGWSAPQPAHLLRPTYWPMVFALGIALILWGFTSSLVVSGAGAILATIGIAYWIGELRHEP